MPSSQHEPDIENQENNDVILLYFNISKELKNYKLNYWMNVI